MICVLHSGEGITFPYQPTGTSNGRETSMSVYLHVQLPPQQPGSLSFLPASTSSVGPNSHMYLIFKNKVNIPVAVIK